MDDLRLAKEAAELGANIVQAAAPGSARFKGVVDPVTETDLKAEREIRALIARERPTDRIVGEEGGGTVEFEGRCWIIDPLDGTVNFVHGIPQVAVSIAMYEDGVPKVAAVADVFRGELFDAGLDEGCRLNGRQVSVSDIEDIGGAVIATGFPYDRRQHGSNYAQILGSVLERAQGIRRIGAAALDLAWVACGRFDGYWEFGLAPWDIAAGMLLVREAGGRVTDHLEKDSSILDPLFIASNDRIHSQLVEVIREAMPEGWPADRQSSTGS